MKPKKQIKDIWGWLNEITLYKTPIDQISDDSWDHWNSYVIHRFISMNLNFVELANFIQIIPYEKKKQTYQIYREFIPNQKDWSQMTKIMKYKIPSKVLMQTIKRILLRFERNQQKLPSYPLGLVLSSLDEKEGTPTELIKDLAKKLRNIHR